MTSSKIEGLYAITPDISDTASLIRLTRRALIGGARLIQYRNKTVPALHRLEQARGLAALCRQFQVPLIVNDCLDLAVEVEADGVHLGLGDAPITDARRKLGSGKIIGASCYNQLERALEAQDQGADYVAFGAFFPSLTKPNAAIARKDVLLRAKALLHVPIVAIGGINTSNANELICKGADAIAVSNAVFGASDVQTEAKIFARLFKQSNNPFSPVEATQ